MTGQLPKLPAVAALVLPPDASHPEPTVAIHVPPCVAWMLSQRIGALAGLPADPAYTLVVDAASRAYLAAVGGACSQALSHLRFSPESDPVLSCIRDGGVR